VRICSKCNKEEVTAKGARLCETCRRLCSKCGMRRKSQRGPYCNECHAANMKKTRPKYAELTEEQRRKIKCRSYANTYLRRGLIQRGPCEVKGCTEHAQMHHDDYSKPLEVRWFCRRHHEYHHQDNGYND